MPNRRYAGVFPVNARGQILLQLRDDRPDLGNPNTWTTLGGLIEPGETPEEAARRELVEECGRAPAQLTHVAAAVRRRSTGELIVVYSYAAAVDWSLDDLILGEGQGLAWVEPDALPVLPLNPVIAADIRAFASSPLREQLALIAPPPRDRETMVLPPDLARRLGIRPGSLVALHGATAAFAGRLRALLLDGARLTASPAAHERPDIILWWPHRAPGGTRRRSELLAALAPRGALWVVRHRGDDPLPDALVIGGMTAGQRLGIGEEQAVRLMPEAQR